MTNLNHVMTIGKDYIKTMFCKRIKLLKSDTIIFHNQIVKQIDLGTNSRKPNIFKPGSHMPPTSATTIVCVYS